MIRKCAVCKVRMSKGHKKGPKPLVCSRSACKKKWYNQHMTLDVRWNSWASATDDNRLLRENPDAWDDYFDSE